MTSNNTIETLRAGIVTFHFSENYGALLQAYSLRKWLIEQDLRVEFVNYRPSHVELGGRIKLPVSVVALKADLKIAYLALMQLRHRLFGRATKMQRFEAFERDALGVTGPSLSTASEVDAYLARPEGRYDLLICGSDQIWAPSIQFGFDPVYFLKFRSGAQGARRCSYAPSFGRAALHSQQEAEVSGYLSDLDALSVRENSGVALARRLSGKPVSWVPDPTILLGDFSELAALGAGEFGSDHVFCYALRTSAGIRDVAGYVAQALQSPVLSPMNPHRRWREIGRTVYPSPSGWVAGLAQSRYVVTNSFHGTVFSILFRKPFLTVALPGARAGMNERSRSLLHALGLEDRLVDGADMSTVARRFAEPIDWESVTPKLSQMQAAGREYLKAQIEAIT